MEYFTFIITLFIPRGQRGVATKTTSILRSPSRLVFTQGNIPVYTFLRHFYHENPKRFFVLQILDAKPKRFLVIYLRLYSFHTELYIRISIRFKSSRHRAFGSLIRFLDYSHAKFLSKGPRVHPPVSNLGNVARRYFTR